MGTCWPTILFLCYFGNLILQLLLKGMRFDMGLMGNMVGGGGAYTNTAFGLRRDGHYGHHIGETTLISCAYLGQQLFKSCVIPVHCWITGWD